MLCSASRPPVEPPAKYDLTGAAPVARLDDDHRRVARLLERVAAPVGERLVVEAERAVERAARAGLVAGIAGEHGVAARDGKRLVARALGHVADDVGDGAVEAAAAIHQRLLVPGRRQRDAEEDVRRRGIDRRDLRVDAAVFGDRRGRGHDSGGGHGAARRRQPDGAGGDRQPDQVGARRLRRHEGRGARHHERGNRAECEAMRCQITQ
jgi:hypothetical protein